MIEDLYGTNVKVEQVVGSAGPVIDITRSGETAGSGTDGTMDRLTLEKAIELAVELLAAVGNVDPRRLRSGIVNGIPFVVRKEDAVTTEDARVHGQQAITLLEDLDRSPAGRHQGDTEAQDETGVSQGNPYLLEGTRIGTHISGRPIIVPAPDKLRDPNLWYGEREGA